VRAANTTSSFIEQVATRIIFNQNPNCATAHTTAVEVLALRTLTPIASRRRRCGKLRLLTRTTRCSRYSTLLAISTRLFWFQIAVERARCNVAGYSKVRFHLLLWLVKGDRDAHLAG